MATATAMAMTLAGNPDGEVAKGPDEGQSIRVAGEAIAEVQRDGETWRCGACVIRTSLPVGYPAPTAPGAIELKRYPSVRRAEVTGEMQVELGMNAAFWPLFRHIKDRDIAMTAPVEMDYRQWSSDEPGRVPSWTMSFLYRTAEDGPTEESGQVRVVDTEPVTVVSIGTRGRYSMRRQDEALASLLAWVDASAQWERAGDPRTLSYNGPEVRPEQRWGEIQMPVRPRQAPAADAPTPAESDER